MNNNYGEGIANLQNSIRDLNQIQQDIKNHDPDKIQADWQRTQIDLGKAYVNLPGIKDDPNLKHPAFTAYEKYERAAINPANAHHIAALSASIQKLIYEMEKSNKSALPEWD